MIKKVVFLFTAILSLFLTACGNDDFQGRYIAPEGITTYEFMPEGKVTISDIDDKTTAKYKYDKKAQTITVITGEADKKTLKVNADGNLEMDDVTLSRGVDASMLADSTWIGHQGDYTFALTFSLTEEGLETYSELVTYYDDDMTYVYQTDDSVTRLMGDELWLDRTVYIVSEVTDKSLRLSIGNNSMVINKHPKGTAIEFREGYTNIDDEPLQ